MPQTDDPDTHPGGQREHYACAMAGRLQHPDDARDRKGRTHEHHRRAHLEFHAQSMARRAVDGKACDTTATTAEPPRNVCWRSNQCEPT